MDEKNKVVPSEEIVKEKIKPSDSEGLKAEIREKELNVPDLHTMIVAEEEIVNRPVSFKETLITLVDAYMTRDTLTPEQGAELASLRGKIITGLTDQIWTIPQPKK